MVCADARTGVQAVASTSDMPHKRVLACRVKAAYISPDSVPVAVYISTRYARSLTAYLLTAAAVAGLFAVPNATRVHDRVIRGVRMGGQRLEFSHDDHRHITSEDLQPSVAATALVADANHDGRVSNSPSKTVSTDTHSASAVLTAALVLRDDTFVRRLSPPGGPHTPRLAPLTPTAGRAPPSIS